jgi:hypothetical protein
MVRVYVGCPGGVLRLEIRRIVSLIGPGPAAVVWVGGRFMSQRGCHYFSSSGGDLATVITPQEAWYLGGALGITVINIYCLAAVTPRPP